MSDPRYQALFNVAGNVTPFLCGTLCQGEAEIQWQEIDHLIFSDRDNQTLLQQIYAELQFAYPEAGHAYWLSRTWTLLIWQPVYISFISIYGIHALPSLRHITQHWQSDTKFVAGFSLPDESMFEGSTEQLIQTAGHELSLLFEHYRQQLDSHLRIRPGFTKHIIADSLIIALLRLQELGSELAAGYIPTHAKLWLQAFHLPLKALQSLHFNTEKAQWCYVRSSCCMVFRCKGLGMCPDCPRAKKHPQQ